VFFVPESVINSQAPLILVAHGTGIAPLRSILQKIHSQVDKSKIGPILLYYGIRSTRSINCDFLYKKELKSIFSDLKAFNKETNIFIACSEGDEHNNEEEACSIGQWRSLRINMAYVQDKMIDNHEIIHDYLFNQKGYIFVCGNGDTLIKDVRKSLLKIISLDNESIEKQECDHILRSLQEEKRYLQEYWE